MAYHFDQMTKCILMTQIVQGTSIALALFVEVKGKTNYFSIILDITRLMLSAIDGWIQIKNK